MQRASWVGGGGGYENKLKDASFIFPMTNVTMKNTPILNILALLLFLKLESICSKSGLNGTQYKDKKWGEGMGGSRKCTFSRYFKW